MAQPHVIFIYCLYLGKLYPEHRIGDKAQLVERSNDDLDFAGSSPLYASIFLPIMFSLWHCLFLHLCGTHPFCLLFDWFFFSYQIFTKCWNTLTKYPGSAPAIS